ncbi:MAG: hypothetical protein NZM37_10405 [Sandaracinaceae bacterium]|nr:hypothetical protein [Sandaracinaceae bacterium]
MSSFPPWPKGPFPERYRFAQVALRLDQGWTEGRKEALGWLMQKWKARPFAFEDPWLRLVEIDGPCPIPRLREMQKEGEKEGLFVFLWIPYGKARGTGDGGLRLGVVPTRDPLDAVSAVGVAGPHQGIGLMGVLRFLLMLRHFGPWHIDAMGEDAIELELIPNDALAAMRVADRAIVLCPALAQRESRESLAQALLSSHRLRLDWGLALPSTSRP